MHAYGADEVGWGWPAGGPLPTGMRHALLRSSGQPLCKRPLELRRWPVPWGALLDEGDSVCPECRAAAKAL